MNAQDIASGGLTVNIVEIRVSPGGQDLPGAYRFEPATTGMAVPCRRIDLALGKGSVRPADLLRNLRNHTRGCTRPVVLLTGPLALQLDCLWRLQVLYPPGTARIVLCVTNADRPLLLPPLHGRWPIDALVIDDAPMPVETRNWSNRIATGVGERVFRLPPPTVGACTDAGTAAALRANLAPDGRTWMLALVAQRTDAWMALGMHPFRIWARGSFGLCEECGLYNLDRLRAESASYEAILSCRHCGAALRRGSPRDHARMVIVLLGSEHTSPDPDVLVKWLNVDQQIHVLAPDGSPAETASCCMLAADAALVLADPAFANPIFDLAIRNCARVISNDARTQEDGHGIALEGTECDGGLPWLDARLSEPSRAGRRAGSGRARRAGPRDP